MGPIIGSWCFKILYKVHVNNIGLNFKDYIFNFLYDTLVAIADKIIDKIKTKEHMRSLFVVDIVLLILENLSQ